MRSSLIVIKVRDDVLAITKVFHWPSSCEVDHRLGGQERRY